MTALQIFKNDRGYLRAGWQVALFVLLFGVIGAALIVPMVNLLQLRGPFEMSAASLVAVLIATWALTGFVNHKPLSAVGLAVNRHTVRELGIGSLLGWFMMTGIFGVEYLLGYVKVVSMEMTLARGLQTFLLSLVFFAIAAMAEEVLFRGYVFQVLARGIGVIPAVLATGVLFGLAHVGNPNASAFGVANTILVSVLFCMAYWRTRGLWLPFGIHFSWNFSQTTLYGFPTSGQDFTRYELTQLTQFGDEWLTGGTYGPEGGALATISILLCGAYMYFARTLRPYPGIVTLEHEGETLNVPFFGRDSYSDARVAA